MTKEEAVSVLERVAHTESKWPGTEDTLEALDMAISALRVQYSKGVEIDQVKNDQKWISVNEMLPRCGERVLARSGPFVGEAYRTSAGSWYRQSGIAWRDALDSSVTHWMPLPEPPADG